MANDIEQLFRAMQAKAFWLYGCSGAGKTTLAGRLRNGMADRGRVLYATVEK